MVVFLSGFQNCGRKGGLVGCIREKLGFQTEAMPWTVGAATLSAASLGNKVGCVKMPTYKKWNGICIN